LLGPNGAGKTTTVEILEGFRKRDAGEVAVLGFDPANMATSLQLRERMGIVLQELASSPSSRCAKCFAATPATSATRGRWTS